MNDLPADLTGPLHLPDPYPGAGFLIGLAAVTLAALLALVWRRLRRRRARPRTSAPAAVTGAVAAATPEIVGRIEKIRVRYKHADRRRGCHELAATLRRHLDADDLPSAGRPPFASLTVGEITAALGESAVARFFEILGGYQFGRRAPSREEFQSVCDLAVEIVRVGPNLGSRRP